MDVWRETSGRLFVSNAELRRCLGIKGIKEEMRISRLGWYGHVERRILYVRDDFEGAQFTI